MFNRQREVLAKKLESCTSTLSTVYLGEVFKLQLSECIKMFESYLEDLQTALGNCSEGVASGQHYCNLVTSGWIKFGCGNAVARLAEATRNELGAWAELQRAVHLERKMKSEQR